MRVLVTGAAGYLGGAVVPALVEAGHEVRGFVHAGGAGGLPPHLHGIQLASGDVLTGAGLDAACVGMDAVVHLVGIVRESRGRTMEAVHVGGTRATVAAAVTAGVRRFVQVSAVGARPDGISAYQRTKARAEEIVSGSGLVWTIIRPTVIFGRGGPGHNLVSELAAVLRAPLAPVFGDGRYLMQPISAANVARGCAAALGRADAVGRVYEAGGPERLTYEEVLRRIAAAMGRPFRPVHVPLGPVRAAVPLLQHLPGFPITAEQLAMLLEGTVCDANAYFADLGLRPERFEGPAILGRG